MHGRRKIKAINQYPYIKKNTYVTFSFLRVVFNNFLSIYIFFYIRENRSKSKQKTDDKIEPLIHVPVKESEKCPSGYRVFQYYFLFPYLLFYIFFTWILLGVGRAPRLSVLRYFCVFLHSFFIPLVICHSLSPSTPTLCFSYYLFLLLSLILPPFSYFLNLSLFFYVTIISTFNFICLSDFYPFSLAFFLFSFYSYSLLSFLSYFSVSLISLPFSSQSFFFFNDHKFLLLSFVHLLFILYVLSFSLSPSIPIFRYSFYIFFQYYLFPVLSVIFSLCFSFLFHDSQSILTYIISLSSFCRSISLPSISPSIHFLSYSSFLSFFIFFCFSFYSLISILFLSFFSPT